ncbi:WD40 repeat domain-containing protein [Kitasatospora sp. NPDC056184]|uniref:WD40 repeat domain-containing protein n=1 Tax=Kitasatospora sp. NPDC056184 TaxID=3345738 RepID=UPI0035DC2958
MRAAPGSGTSPIRPGPASCAGRRPTGRDRSSPWGSPRTEDPSGSALRPGWDCTTSPVSPRPLGERGTSCSPGFPRSGSVPTVGSCWWTVRGTTSTSGASTPGCSLPRGGGQWLVPGSFPSAAAFSPDGRTLAVGGGTGAVRIVSLQQQGRWIETAPGAFLTGPTGAVDSIALTPNGRTVAVASADGSVRLWDLDPTAAIDTICATGRGALTAEIWKKLVPEAPFRDPCADRADGPA